MIIVEYHYQLIAELLRLLKHPHMPDMDRIKPT